MFEHSVKVPRHFKVVANIVKQVSTEGGSVKTLLYDTKLRHFKTNVLYALITETVKHAADLDKIFAHCQLLQTESRLDPWLAKVLATELLFGKKTLPGKSKPEQTILSYKEQFEKYVSEHQDDLKTEVAPRPRYVRINTNLFTTSDAIRAFQDEGYHFIRCTSGSYEDYLAQIQKLTEYDFTQDYHIKTIFVFAPGTKWHDHELYLENKVILQDKATAMAVHLLAAPTGSVCLDMCAAPGMKTTQLAAYLRNEGKIYAVERDEKRYQTLCDFVEKTGSKCVTTINADSLALRGDYQDVEYILLDPSCSGSGMDYCMHSYIEDTRLAKLTSLQEKFLKHAMNAFPKAKRIIYSTCSLYPEENERVVTNVVKTSRAKWRVQDVKTLLKGQWNNFGSCMYGSMGSRCMYAKPDADMTTGFFLAVLDRDDKDLAKAYRQEEIDDSKKDSSKCANGSEDNSKKKSKKDDAIGDSVKEGNDSDELEASQSEISDEGRQKKSKKKDDGATEESVDLEVNQRNTNQDKGKKKTKKNAASENKNETSLEGGAHNGSDKSKNKKRNKLEIDAQMKVEEAPKKKKKNIEDSADVHENIDQEKSKKKKRKVKEVCENLENLSVEESTEVPRKKKKDKHKVSESEEDNEISQDIENESKHKNKVTDKQLNDVADQKKKKKKSKVAESN